MGVLDQLPLRGVGELSVWGLGAIVRVWPALGRHVLWGNHGLVVLGFHVVAVLDGNDGDNILLGGGEGGRGVRPPSSDVGKGAAALSLKHIS